MQRAVRASTRQCLQSLRIDVARRQYSAQFKKIFPKKQKPLPQDNPLNTWIPVYSNPRAQSKTYRELQKWADENPEKAIELPRHMSAPGEMPNNLSRAEPMSIPQDVSEARADDLSEGTMTMESDSYEDTIGEIENTHYRPGTLVEYRWADSRIPVVAVVMKSQGNQRHLFTITGGISSVQRLGNVFHVSNYVDEHDPVFEDLCSYIGEDGSIRQPPSTVGASLVTKMRQFTKDASQMFQENMTAINTAHDQLSDLDIHTYHSIDDIAKQIYKPDGRSLKSGHSAPALYAIHNALMYHETQAFKMTSLRDHNGQFMYEVMPRSWVRDIQFVENQVRNMLEGAGWPMARTGTTERSQPLRDFLDRARRYIKMSRETREFTNHGMVGSVTQKDHMVALADITWKKPDLRFLRFMEIWACYDQFERGSRLHSIGSSLLRLTEMYDEAEMLSNSLGWTFLQEVRHVLPWDIQARYVHRFPGITAVPMRLGGKSGISDNLMTETTSTGYERHISDAVEQSQREDVAKDYRRKWEGANVFAVDEQSTTLIDDAISLEHIPGKTDEHWIHVHVADPAAFLKPNSPLCEWIELMPQNLYLAGNFENMFPTEFVQNVIMEKYSLDIGRPCLTFSARVNEGGDILQTKIEPGELSNVIFIEGDKVNKVTGNKSTTARSEEPFFVGTRTKFQSDDRKMAEVEDLTDAQKDELKTLRRLGEALQKKRTAKSNIESHLHFSKSSIYVALPSDQNHLKDPYIEISEEGNGESGEVVSSHMQLAGQIAAHWCAERNIPAPFRTQPQALECEDHLRQLAAEASMAAHTAPEKEARKEKFRELITEMGPVELSAEPGPVFAMGVDMYAKATSPLRRYADLLLHWQIHAALEHERNKTPVQVPFKKNVLQTKLRAIRSRERIARRLETGLGAKQWVLQALVRAWRFGEAELPPTFEFTVENVSGRSVTGKLNWFDQYAVAGETAFDGNLRLRDVKKKDRFLVEITDVNVHDARIMVKMVEKLPHLE